MKKMIVVALVLSVMGVSGVMASSGAMSAERRPERVKVNVHIRGDRDCEVANLLHLALCPECRHHNSHMAPPPCCHKPHSPKGGKEIHHGDKHRPGSHHDYRPGGDNKRPGGEPEGRPNGRGEGRGGTGRGHRK